MKIQKIREIAETQGIDARTLERRLNESQMVFPLVARRTNGRTYTQNIILPSPVLKTIGRLVS